MARDGLVALALLCVTLFSTSSKAQTETFEITGYEPQFVVVPGMDYVGWGFNARFRDPFFAYTQQVMEFTYDQNANGREVIYRYPTHRQMFAVPDQVTVRTIGTTSAETELFDSYEEMRFALDLRIGIGIESGNTDIEIAIAIGIRFAQEEDVYVCRTEATSQMWQVSLTTRFPTLQFLADVDDLKAFTYTSNPNAYDKFLTDYGTHFVDEVVMGGLAVTTTDIQTTNTSFALSLALQLTLTQRGSSGNLDLGLELGLGIEFWTVKSNTKSNAVVIGGDARVGDFVMYGDDPDALIALFGSWKKTVARAPGVVYLHMVDIHEIISDRALAKEVCKASKVFVQGKAEVKGC